MLRSIFLLAMTASLWAGELAAQSPTILDARLDYRARENTAGFDNDVFTLDLGRTTFWTAQNGKERGFRLEAFAGHHNIKGFIGGRAQVFEQDGTTQYGGAFSIDSIIGENSGADFALTGAKFWDKWSVYGHAGLQYITEKAAMDDKSIAPIASLRAYYYPFDTTAFSLGASLDGDDPLVHVGVEYTQADAFNGFFFEWVIGPNGYRGEKYYNTLRLGLRVSSFKGLLKARHRKAGDISYARALDSR